MKNLRYKLLALTLFTPLMTFAALQGAKDLLIAIKGIIGLLRPIVVGLAFLYFFWGLGQFILKDAGNDKTREEGKKKMLWGIVALFVMLSIWGILGFISQTTGIPVVITPVSL